MSVSTMSLEVRRMGHFSFVFVVLWICAVSVKAQSSYTQQENEQRLRKANELVEQGNYASARLVYQDFLTNSSKADARRVEAEYGLTSTALKASHKDGEALALRFIEHYPTHPFANSTRFELAQSFYQSQKYGKAISYFAKVDFVALPSEHQAQGKFQLAYSYFTERKLTEALLYFNQVKFTENTYTAAANYYAGFIEYGEGRYDEALADLKKAETNEAYANIVPYLIASVYYRQAKYNDLLTYAEKVKSKEGLKNKNELLLLVAESHYALKDFSKAANAYSASIQDKTIGDAGVWYRAGLSNDKAGNKEEAIRLLELAASSNDPIALVASYQLGIVYLQQSQKAFAINAFDRARKAEDKAIAEQAQFNYAKVLYDEGQSDHAILEFERYLSQYSSGDFINDTRELLAQAYVNGNNYHKAIEYIEALPTKSPATEQAYQKATFLKGSELFNDNKYEAALQFFTKSLSYPRDEKFVQRASYWAGEANAILKKYPEAESFYQLSIRNGKSDASTLLQAHYGLGYVLYNQKQFDKALPHFNDYVKLANKQTAQYADAVLRLADCHYIAKSFDNALVYYNQYKQVGGADADFAYLQAGLIYGIQRKYAECRNQFGTLLSSYPTSRYRAEAMYQRAQFDIEQGEYVNAINGLTQLVSTESTSPYAPYAYARRAASYFNTKNYNKTIEDYSTLISLYPSHPVSQEVLLPLQEALDLAGRSTEFDGYLASVKKANPDNKGLESLEFETAKKMYFNEQYEKAVTALRNFVTTYPQSAFVLESNYYIGESYYRLRQWEQAALVYTGIINHPTFSFAARVASRLADVQFKLGKYQEAVSGYHYYEQFAVSKKDLFTALSGLMESFYLLAQYDSSDFYARQIIERAAINAGAENKASLYLGKGAMARGDYAGAEDEFLNTLNAARDEYGAEAKYSLATIFYLKKDYKQCYETLISLNKDFSSYDEWVGKAFLLLSDNYLAQNQVFQAKATLQSLVDNFPLQVVKDEASLKLKALEKQEAALLKQDSSTLENR